eukprot:381093-Pyramimonas_sp.AAC.1
MASNLLLESLGVHVQEQSEAVQVGIIMNSAFICVERPDGLEICKLRLDYGERYCVPCDHPAVALGEHGMHCDVRATEGADVALGGVITALAAPEEDQKHSET